MSNNNCGHYISKDKRKVNSLFESYFISTVKHKILSEPLVITYRLSFYDEQEPIAIKIDITQLRLEVENSFSEADINVATEKFLSQLRLQIAESYRVDILQVNLIFLIRSDGSFARIEVLPPYEFIKDNVKLSVVLSESRETTMLTRLNSLLEQNGLTIEKVLHSDNWSSSNTREIKNLIKYLKPRGFLVG